MQRLAEMHKHSFQPQLCTKPTNKVRARALLNAKLTRSSVWGKPVSPGKHQVIDLGRCSGLHAGKPR